LPTLHHIDRHAGLARKTISFHKTKEWRMTEQDRIRKIHLNEQTWRHFREWRETMYQVLDNCADHEDSAALLKGLCSYVLIRMELEDSEVEEELKTEIKIASMKKSLNLLTCHTECDSCDHEEECGTLADAIDKLENE
jgi:hypothetical protein